MTVDVLLANPLSLAEDAAERELMTPYFPLGLLYLAAYVRDRGFRVAVFDGTFSEEPDAFERALEEHRPTVFGTTALAPTRESALRLSRKAHAHGAKVVLGGPDPTRHPADYVAEPGVDVVVHHEGEETLVELLGVFCRDDGTRPLGDIPGLAFRDDDGEIVVTAPRPVLDDLDRLPTPARDLIDLDRYLELWRTEHGYASVSVSVSRGCPYGCEWCEESVHGPTLRMRSPESVAAEVKALGEAYPIDRLRLVDDVDGLDAAWLNAWARAAERENAVVPFEALSDLRRRDIPMLDSREPL